MRIPSQLAAILAALLSVLMLSLPSRAADLVVPDPAIAPTEVVAIQMKALQFNDNPVSDFGIAQTWNFAHPRNRAATGPLQRFAGMLKGPGYGTMLNHIDHRIEAQANDGTRANFDVYMETAQGRMLHFMWSVELVDGGEFDNCWMTVAVSMPRDAGQGS